MQLLALEAHEAPNASTPLTQYHNHPNFLPQPSAVYTQPVSKSATPLIATTPKNSPSKYVRNNSNHQTSVNTKASATTNFSASPIKHIQFNTVSNSTTTHIKPMTNTTSSSLFVSINPASTSKFSSTSPAVQQQLPMRTESPPCLSSTTSTLFTASRKVCYLMSMVSADI